MEADPLRERSPRLFALFVLYLRWLFWRKFDAVRLSRTGLPAVPAGRPLIIYSNHPSWWDPALYILLCGLLFPGRAGFGPMDGEALTRYRLLRRMGVFGIDLDSKRGAARFLSTSLRVLSDPSAILWITAEGRFTDPRLRPVRLRPGIAHLARRIPDAVILPLAIDYTFWNESRPEALVRFGEPVQAGDDRSVTAWTAALEKALTATMDGLAAESGTRDPALFQPILQGAAGPGGIYDLIRRAASWSRGRRFDPRHEQRDA
jgi:1-acyl-sn-glycerol-3-phosphate acyltransferase